MNIHELGKKSGIPLKTLRKLDSLGVLKIDPEPARISELLFHMRGNQTFTVPMLLWLIDEPDLIDELGFASPLYEKRARTQIAALGDIAATSAPKHVTAEIREAGKGNEDSAHVIAAWLKSVLPVEPVSYHWIAIRLLAPLNDFLRAENQPMLTLALLGVRQLPEFAAYWRAEKSGVRNTIKYFRPALDL